MKEILKKCIISRYDETITEPPFETIQIDEVEVLEPQGLNDLGIEFTDRLRLACANKGYAFKFYTSCSEREDIDYEIVVYGENENVFKGLFS
jgi:hypothetical protein